MILYFIKNFFYKIKNLNKNRIESIRTCGKSYNNTHCPQIVLGKLVIGLGVLMTREEEENKMMVILTTKMMVKKKRKKKNKL